MKFHGTLREGFDGENCSAEGTLILDDGTQHGLVAYAAGRDAEVRIDGRRDEELGDAVAEWLATVWPSDGWTPDPTDDVWKEQQASLG